MVSNGCKILKSACDSRQRIVTPYERYKPVPTVFYFVHVQINIFTSCETLLRQYWFVHLLSRINRYHKWSVRTNWTGRFSLNAAPFPGTCNLLKQVFLNISKRSSSLVRYNKYCSDIDYGSAAYNRFFKQRFVCLHEFYSLFRQGCVR